MTRHDTRLSAERYNDEITMMADAIEEYLEEFADDAEDVFEFAHEEVDACELVFKPRYHLDVLAHAEHEPRDEFVMTGADTFDDVLTHAVYDVMRQDLVDALRDREVLD